MLARLTAGVPLGRFTTLPRIHFQGLKAEEANVTSNLICKKPHRDTHVKAHNQIKTWLSKIKLSVFFIILISLFSTACILHSISISARLLHVLNQLDKKIIDKNNLGSAKFMENKSNFPSFFNSNVIHTAMNSLSYIDYVGIATVLCNAQHNLFLIIL
ncbi:hypothetical protein BY996DRAFT_1586892 [Phakopsora pachyrhizi]|nr:hypothetical protein BY996DRAFT_1586892 [Phakopsora pachyrhizi]